MDFLEKKYLNHDDKKRIMQLWNKEYPANLNYSSLSEFEEYLEVLEDPFHLVAKLNDQIEGWYFDFLREDERWFGLILSSDFHGKGLGTKILNKVRKKRIQLSGWIIRHDNYLKINGLKYKSPEVFYLKNGFNILDAVQLKTDQIHAVKIEWKKSAEL